MQYAWDRSEILVGKHEGKIRLEGRHSTLNDNFTYTGRSKVRKTVYM